MWLVSILDSEKLVIDEAKLVDQAGAIEWAERMMMRPEAVSLVVKHVEEDTDERC